MIKVVADAVLSRSSAMGPTSQRFPFSKVPTAARLLNALTAFLHDLHWSQRFYLAFVVLGAAYVLTIKTLPQHWSDALLAVVAVAGAIAALIDAYRLYQWIFRFIWGKLLLAGIYAVTTNTALGMAGVVVNSITATDIVELPLTRNVMAILLVPSLAILATIFLTFAGILLASIYCLLSMALQLTGCKKDITFIEHTLPFPTYLARILVMICFLAAAPQVSEKVNAQQKGLEGIASFFAFHFEALRHTRCALADNQTAVKGSDGEYLVITKNDSGYEFEERVCPQRRY